MQKSVYDKELETLVEPKKNRIFFMALVFFLALFSYFGYLILTEEPPKSESNFFDSIGINADKIHNKW